MAAMGNVAWHKMAATSKTAERGTQLQHGKDMSTTTSHFKNGKQVLTGLDTVLHPGVAGKVAFYQATLCSLTKSSWFLNRELQGAFFYEVVDVAAFLSSIPGLPQREALCTSPAFRIDERMGVQFKTFCGHHSRYWREHWCPQAPCWWTLLYTNIEWHHFLKC